jgi:hypothetical protein
MEPLMELNFYGWSPALPRILDYKVKRWLTVANTLANLIMTKITAVKSLILLAPGADPIK